VHSIYNPTACWSAASGLLFDRAYLTIHLTRPTRWELASSAGCRTCQAVPASMARSRSTRRDRPEIIAAEKYFDMNEPNLTPWRRMGVTSGHSPRKYDVIAIDATAHLHSFHLTTREFFAQARDH